MQHRATALLFNAIIKHKRIPLLRAASANLKWYKLPGFTIAAFTQPTISTGDGMKWQDSQAVGEVRIK